MLRRSNDSYTFATAFDLRLHDNWGTNTTQLFFPQDVIDTINTTISPYSAEGANPTTNASDHVYSGEVDGGTLLTLSGDNTNGDTATFKVNLPIKALSSAGV